MPKTFALSFPGCGQFKYVQARSGKWSINDDDDMWSVRVRWNDHLSQGLENLVCVSYDPFPGSRPCAMYKLGALHVKLMDPMGDVPCFFAPELCQKCSDEYFHKDNRWPRAVAAIYKSCCWASLPPSKAGIQDLDSDSDVPHGVKRKAPWGES